MTVSRYATLIFDCDGVVLDSNTIKTEAFRTAAQPWGHQAAEALVAHHIANGGISRYKKFDHFLSQILPELGLSGTLDKDGPGLEAMLTIYAQEAREGLMNCSIAGGLEELRAATAQANWLIVSGGDQEELRSVFNERGLASLFDGGIYGSPDSKPQVLEREIHRGNIRQPALFLGDSRADHQAASQYSIDFIFVSAWTDLPDWQAYVREYELRHIPAIHSLLEEPPAFGRQ
ncbi:MAG: HAD family hydrolase [Wenzhouxiangella sp.]